MTDERPTPEQMLARAKTEGVEHRRQRGRLRIFVGYAAGVGKTFSMLQAARARQAEGAEVVVGYVEPHGRPETEALLEGLERLPVLIVPYRGTTLPEFDLDAALARKPELILVDELAHTNAPGLRHAKRWQDIEELLSAGINVYSTVNVQHVESLNDVVAQISGVVVRETFPDEVIDRADEVALVDISPEELLARLRQGKVYIPQQAAHALESFFRKENLVVLRELALRQTADRVGEDVQTARLATAAKLPWPTAERLLVCVGPSPSSAKVIRASKRLADRLDAPWTAVHIETPASARWTQSDRQRLTENLRLAERLGAEVAQLSGADVVAEVIGYARQRNVTKIVLGKTEQPQRFFRRRRALVDRLIQDSGNIDVFVVRGAEEPFQAGRPHRRLAFGQVHWLGTSLALGVATLTGLLFHEVTFTEANIVMAYLVAVAFVASRYGRFPAVVASVASVLLFDVLFTEPYYNITVHDTQYLVTFVIMLAVGVWISTLSAQLRYEAETSRRSERRMEALYRLTRGLTAVSGKAQLMDTAERAVAEVFDAYAVVFTPDEQGRIRPVIGRTATFAASDAEFAAAQWAFDHEQMAGLGTDTLPAAPALYVPLTTQHGTVGVLAVQPERPDSLSSPDSRQLLWTYAAQIAFALERLRLVEDSRQTHVQFETERLRSSLLSAVSHDLRTPLAVIAGASGTLAARSGTLDTATRQELLQTICEEAERLTRLVENLLHMTRLSAGQIRVEKQWHPLEDVIGSALNRLEKRLTDREVEVRLPEELPLASFDPVLIEQVLVNLLENAVKYSPPGSPLQITADATADGVWLSVADRGRGITVGEEERLFEMFYRGAEATSDQRGAGLGLAICRAIVQAHGGTIRIENRQGGGACALFTLPHDGKPPLVTLDRETS